MCPWTEGCPAVRWIFSRTGTHKSPLHTHAHTHTHGWRTCVVVHTHTQKNAVICMNTHIFYVLKHVHTLCPWHITPLCRALLKPEWWSENRHTRTHAQTHTHTRSHSRTHTKCLIDALLPSHWVRIPMVTESITLPSPPRPHTHTHGPPLC